MHIIKNNKLKQIKEKVFLDKVLLTIHKIYYLNMTNLIKVK